MWLLEKVNGVSEGLRKRSYFENMFKESHGEYYILKCDISKFFKNINHDKLKLMLNRKIKDKDALKITFDIIDSYDEGLAIRIND